MPNKEIILEIARDKFAHQGIPATSVQDIADHSGTSKANVLYHFSSKELLLDAALAPALDALEAIVAGAQQTLLSRSSDRQAFVDAFVDFLLAHRMSVQIVVSHPYLADSAQSLQRAQALMHRLASVLADHTADETELTRFGIAVSGATYALVSGGILGIEPMDPDKLRTILRDFLQSTLHLEASAPAVVS